MPQEPQSGTPRTNALRYNPRTPVTVELEDIYTLSETLERELNEANKHRMEDCSMAISQSSLVIKVAKERDSLQQELSQVRGELARKYLLERFTK